jgi:hypothetical protein
MYFHRRFLEDGSCEIVCTHCFRTIGVAAGLLAIKKLEAAHICAAAGDKSKRSAQSLDLNRAMAAMPLRPAKNSDWISVHAGKVLGLPLPLLLPVVTLLLYGLPTAIELLLLPHTGIWFASIVLGDLTACVCIFAVFKMRRTGVILYLLLIIGKSLLYTAHIIPVNVLPWITDIIPVLAVIGRIVSMRPRSMMQAVPRP